MEHSSPEALRKYLKEHPDADKTKHSVVKSKNESSSSSSESEHEHAKTVESLIPKSFGDKNKTMSTLLSAMEDTGDQFDLEDKKFDKSSGKGSMEFSSKDMDKKVTSRLSVTFTPSAKGIEVELTHKGVGPGSTSFSQKLTVKSEKELESAIGGAAEELVDKVETHKEKERLKSKTPESKSKQNDPPEEDQKQYWYPSRKRAKLQARRYQAAPTNHISDALLRVAKGIEEASLHPREASNRLAFVRMALSQTAQQAVEAMGSVQADSEDAVRDGFKKSNPALTESQLDEIVQHWRDNKDVVKDKHKTAAKMLPEDWTDTDKGSVQRVQYSGGPTHTWTVEGEGKSFTVQVKTDEGTWKAKKTFPSLESGQRFAWRYIDKAHGAEVLKADLTTSFKKEASFRAAPQAHVVGALRRIASDVQACKIAPKDAWTRLAFVRMALSQTAQQAVEAMGSVQADSREKVIDGFKKSNPALTEDQLEEIADQWEQNKDVVKDKTASANAEDSVKLLKRILVKRRSDLQAIEAKEGERRREILDLVSSIEEAVQASLKSIDPKDWTEARKIVSATLETMQDAGSSLFNNGTRPSFPAAKRRMEDADRRLERLLDRTY
jgi:hypothetical protein